jgi:hypothetical protein
MASPPARDNAGALKSRLKGFINGIKRSVSRNKFHDGSSRRGRAYSDVVRVFDVLPVKPCIACAYGTVVFRCRETHLMGLSLPPDR